MTRIYRRWENPSTGVGRETYASWSAMLDRCYKPKAEAYKNYGVRGIVVCERWRGNYDAFVRDLGLRPAGMKLERIDNAGNYEPENCRWATDIEQHNNTRRNRFITFQGQTRGVAAWARVMGISRATLSARLNRLPVEQAMSKYFRWDL